MSSCRATNAKALAETENAIIRSRMTMRTNTDARLYRRLTLPVPLDTSRPDLEALRLQAREATLKWIDALSDSGSKEVV